MTERRYDRRVRLEIEVRREIPTDTEIAAHEKLRSESATNYLPLPDRVWTMTLRGEGASGEELNQKSRGWWYTLAEVVSYVRSEAFSNVVDEMADEGAPVLHFRAASRLGVWIEPSREDQAGAVARALGIAEPSSPEGVELLVSAADVASDLIHSTRVRMARS